MEAELTDEQALLAAIPAAIVDVPMVLLDGVVIGMDESAAFDQLPSVPLVTVVDDDRTVCPVAAAIDVSGSEGNLSRASGAGMFSPGPPPLMTPPHRPAQPPAIITELQLDAAMEPAAALAAGSTMHTSVTLEAALAAEAAAPAVTGLAPLLAEDQSDSPGAELLTPRVRVASAGSPDSDTFVASWPSAASSVSTFSVSPQSPFVKIRSSSIPGSPVVPLTLNATA